MRLPDFKKILTTAQQEILQRSVLYRIFNKYLKIYTYKFTQILKLSKYNYEINQYIFLEIFVEKL